MRNSPYIRRDLLSMQAYTPGEQPRDARIIKLNTNENPYPPSPRVYQTLAAFDADRLRRYPDPRSMRLREALARRHRCPVEQVFAANGSDELLALMTRALVADDGAIAFFEPSYSLYPVLTRIRGVTARPTPLTDDFSWSPDAVAAASLCFLAHPHAPSGLAQPRSRVERLCDRFDGVVVIDEAYADFASDTYLDLALRRPNVMVARTLSKSYSLAGLRVGYAIGPAALIEALDAIKDSYNLDALAQELALAAIEDSAWMETNVQRVKQTRQRLTAALRKLGWMVYDSEANFVWARPAGGTAQAVFEKLRLNHILTRWFSESSTKDYVRITVGTDDEIDALLDVVKREAEI